MGKSQQLKKNTPQQHPAPSGPPKPMTDYASFEADKLSVASPYKTKYNVQAKIKYDGDDLLLRTPYFKRCFLDKFDDGPAQLTLLMRYDGDSFEEKIKDLQSEVLNRVTQQLVDHPMDKKRNREGEAVDPVALAAELEENMKPLIINDNPEYAEKLRTSITVTNQETKKLTEPVDCKIFLTELDGTTKPLKLRDMSDLLEDRQFFYEVRVVLHFTHVYIGTANGKKTSGIKHNVKAVQLKRVQLGEREDAETVSVDAEAFLA